MKENWKTAFEMMIHHEGGFTADKRDSGNSDDGYGNQGSTNLGVTAKVWAEWTGKPAPIDVMKELTIEDVEPLYKKNYWDRCKCDDLVGGFDLSVFDMAVNAGTGRSAKFVQKICGATQDGAIGGKTLALLKGIGAEYAINEFAKIRLEYYSSLSAYKHYGRGWDRRTEETRKKSLDMVQ